MPADETKDLSVPLERRADPLAAGGVDPESITAIDSHFDELTKKRAAESGDSPPVDPPADPAVGPPAAAPNPTAPADKPSDKTPPADDPVVAAKPADDKPVDPPAEADKPVDKSGDKPPEPPAPKADLYPEVKLPPTARGASAEAFATVKARAAQDIAARDQQIDALKKELDGLKEQSKNTVPAQEVEALRKENDELRAFRSRLDIQADPGFAAKFDQRVNVTSEFIYSRLKATGKITDETIKKIRDLGGPGAVDMEPILERIEDAQAKRTIQSKLDELEGISFEREQALKEAQADVTKYVEQRRQEFSKAATAHTETTKQILTNILAQVPWMAPVKVAADAKPEEKEAAAQHEAFLKEMNQTLAEAVQDDTPQMRAVLISGLAQHFHLRRTHEALVKERDALKAELETARKETAQVTEKLEAIKRAGSARRESNAPPSGKILGAINPTATADEAFAAWEASRGQG